MSNVSLVLVVLELHLEAESVIEAAALALHAVLVVAYLVTVSHPAKVLPLCRVLGVDKRFLALVVGGVWLDEVYYIELVV